MFKQNNNHTSFAIRAGFILLCGILISGCTLKKESEKKAQKDQVLLVEGLLSLKKGDLKTAIQKLEQAIEANPDNSNAVLIASRIYLSAERFNDAIRILAPAVERHPNNGEIPYSLAIAFKGAGKPKLAYLAAKRSAETFEVWQKKEELKRAKAVMMLLAKDIAENPGQ